MFLLRYNHLCKALRSKIPTKKTKAPKFDYEAKLHEQMQLKRKNLNQKQQQLIKNISEIKNMEVVTELDLNLASFKNSLIQIRKNMLEENQILPKDSRYNLGNKSMKPSSQVKQILDKQQEKNDKTVNFFQKSILLKSLMGLLGINAIGLITSIMGGGFFFGIFLTTILHPSYVAATALMIGKNLSLLLLRHALFLDISDKSIQKLDKINLTEASTFYWFHICKMLGDIGLLGYVNSNLLVTRGDSLDFLLIALYILLTGSVTFHSHFLIHDQHHRLKRLIVFMSVLYCLIYGIYALSYFGQYLGSKEENQKRIAGRKYIEKMFRIQKIKVKDDPINIAIAGKEDQL